MRMPVFLAPLPLAEKLTPEQQRSLMIWLSVLLAIVIVGFVVMMLIRRRITEQEQHREDVGFSLSDLRKMRDRGEITSEEYERTRAKVVASVKRMVDDPKPEGPDRKRGLDGPGAGEGTEGI